jgi:hypothetical protein
VSPDSAAAGRIGIFVVLIIWGLLGVGPCVKSCEGRGLTPHRCEDYWVVVP